MLAQLQYVRLLERRDALPPHGEALLGDEEAVGDDYSDTEGLLSHWEELPEAAAAAMAQIALAVRFCTTAECRASVEALAQQAALVSCNGFELCCPSGSGQSVGLGFYPSAAAALNHSCEPCCSFDHGRAGPSTAAGAAQRVAGCQPAGAAHNALGWTRGCSSSAPFRRPASGPAARLRCAPCSRWRRGASSPSRTAMPFRRTAHNTCSPPTSSPATAAAAAGARRRRRRGAQTCGGAATSWRQLLWLCGLT